MADGSLIIRRLEPGVDELGPVLGCPSPLQGGAGATDGNDNPVNLADRRFIGQGIFAVWRQSLLLRDFNNRDRGCQDDTFGVFSNRVPTETFIYRPDLVRNIPFWMRDAVVHYEDITGGGGR